jgi:hypothetical protein
MNVETQHLMHKVQKEVIIIVHVQAMKIYVVTMEAFREKERLGETQKTTIMMVFKFHPPLNVNVFFCKFFFNLTLFITKLKLLLLSFLNFKDISNEQKLKHYA